MTDSASPSADIPSSDEPRGSSRLGRLRAWLSAQMQWVVISVGVLIFLVIYFWEGIFVTIGSGHEGVMYRRFSGGTVVDNLMGEGIHFVPPWDRVFVYDVRTQEVEHSMPALTQDGLTVTVNVSIRYKPEKQLLGLLHKLVGPDYRKVVVVPDVEGSVRRIIGSIPVDSIYQKASGLDQLVLDDAQNNAERSYIKLEAVILRSIELPQDLKAQIEEKLVDKERALAYEYKLQIAKAEAERKRIDSSGVAAANNILTPSLTASVLQWEGIQATRELAKSENAKIVVIGSKSDGLPIILGK
jgi:regulator of protease activity HflC (stomatin/prohibitin superfamily)